MFGVNIFDNTKLPLIELKVPNTMDLLAVFFTALSTVMTILLINLLGIGMSHYKLLTQDLIKRLAELSAKLFLPCLIFTGLSRGLTFEKLMLS